MTTLAQPRAPPIIGEPEVVEDASTAETSDAWLDLKAAVIALQPLQTQDGSIPKKTDHAAAAELVARITAGIRALAPAFPHDAAYLDAAVADFDRWVADGFGVPDFYDSLVAFAPAADRVDKKRHLVVFPMYTQNGSTDRLVEALIVEVIWPEFIAKLEETYTNKLFVSLRLVDFTPGYDTNSAVLFPETVAMREIPAFTWGALFEDREAARFRRVVREAARITKLELLPSQQESARRPGHRRRDVRDVGHDPRPIAHARRPAVRPVHDQAAHAVLPVLARGTALRPDGVPRVRRDGARQRRPTSTPGCRPSTCSTRSSSTASSGSR